MASFTENRSRLQQRNAEAEAAREALFVARERLRELEARGRAHTRAARPGDPRAEEERRRLDAAIREAAAAADGAAKRFEGARAAAGVAWTDFVPFADPRASVRELDPRVPALLLPVRLEIRFMTVPAAAGAAPRRQLWVRVFPDDCALDAFEPTLSEPERADVRRFWVDFWAAGRVASDERGAWRALVAGHGAGRATYLVEQLRPADLDARPTKNDPTDIVLVVAGEPPLPAGHRNAAAACFAALWRADGDAAEEQAALAALRAAVGATAADAILASYEPVNFSVRPPAPRKTTDVAVSVSFLDLPPAAATPATASSWSRAPRTFVLPDRFVLLGYAGGQQVLEQLGLPVPWPLVVGPDPSAPPDEQLRQQDGELEVGEPLRWMVDFARAVEWGLGFKVDLDPARAESGFDRLLVVGLRLGADADNGRGLFETLIDHHRRGRSGFELLPQGTPTNNTEAGGAALARGEGIAEADAAFERLFGAGAPPPPQLRTDGQALAEMLGIDPAVIEQASGAQGTDQDEARAMNVALWPATLGYLMSTMMLPVWGRRAVDATRAFFTRFVSGRGPLPAIRMGQQPYGILPVTAWSRLRWPTDAEGVFLARLHQILSAIDEDWARMAAGVAQVGQPGGDPQRALLDVLGLHSGSVEYHQRYSESLQDLYNRTNLGGAGPRFMAALVAAGSTRAGTELLGRLGYGGAAPDILDQFFFSTQQRLQGPVVDDRPASESAPIRSYTPEGRNYIGWLVDAARHQPERLQKLAGFIEDRVPAALLFILQRHALNLAFWDASARKHEASGLVAADAIATLAREPRFVHVAQGAAASESRLGLLYKTEPVITGSPTKLVLSHLSETLGQESDAAQLDELIRALERLEKVPTARLERAFAEHIDLCSYRLDAWQTGLVHQRLAALRAAAGPDTPTGAAGGSRRGLYLGAYGWLEEARPKPRTLTPVTPPGGDPNAPPAMRDSSNGGYILAPSLNHAVTAAILRNGYVSNATPAAPDTLAVDLSSERVRRALGVLEGIRGGLSLGALLGYQLERGLHDRHALAEVDRFIYKLRKAFPLRADRFASTRTGADVPIEAVEARNVVDGLLLVEHVQRTGVTSYPFGLSDLPAAADAERRVLDEEVARLLDTHDAVADLALAEGVHQAAGGNYDRAAAALDTFGRGTAGPPPDPEVVRTPRTGIGLTHRVALHVDGAADPDVSPVTGISPTPRAQAEPALNGWLAGVLPPPGDVCCRITTVDPVTGDETPHVVTQADLGLQPIDLLYVVDPERDQALAELDDRLIRHVLAANALRPDTEIVIRYAERVAERITFFQLAPLLRHLRALLLSSRALRPSDLALTNEARPAQDGAVFLERVRAARPRGAVAAVRPGVAALVTDLGALAADPVAHRAAIVAGIDTFIDRAVAALAAANRCGIPQTGWGHLYRWKQQRFAALLEQVRRLVTRWGERRDRCDALLSAYDGLPGDARDEQRLALLQEADRLVSTSPILPAPPPDDYRQALDGKRDAFVAKGHALEQILSTAVGTIAALVGEMAAALPVSAFDTESFETTSTEDAAVALAVDLLGTFERLHREIDRRLGAADAALAAHDAAGAPADRVAALERAVKLLLGDDMRVVPRFALPPAGAAEWQNGLDAAASGALLGHLQPPDGSGDIAPLDTWLHGIARVRPKMAAYEAVLVWTGAFGRAEPALSPVQLPHIPGDHWAGLEIAPGTTLDRDRLLYTACYPAAFDPAGQPAGLLLDEWTEVIPAAEETAALAVHYDRPSSEPPQVMLLVTPPVLDQPWQWADVVDAVNQTLDMARKRAVEPTAVDRTPYARFLPATWMATALYQVSITADLGLNNDVYQAVVEVPDGG